LSPAEDVVSKCDTEFVRSLSLFDSVMIVVGSMIGSGIFIVASDIARKTGSSGGLLLTWGITGILTIAAALSYGELAALFPRAGGQYIYLREAYSPLCGFLYGWTLLLVIQTGTIAAVAVGFARYLGVLIPAISDKTWILSPVALSAQYAVSFSVQQIVAVLLVVVLTAVNSCGVRIGKFIQNIFTCTKALSLVAIILVCVIARNAAANENFARFWEIRGAQTIQPETQFLAGIVPSVAASFHAYGLFIAFSVAQVGALFSADAWNNIGFAAAEVKNPQRDVALSMAIGTIAVSVLYMAVSAAYLCVLPLSQIQSAPDDRVASAALAAALGPHGGLFMAAAIVISTFGCNNGLILGGARVVYAMARDGLFFRGTGLLNKNGVPGNALLYQGMWVVFLISVRTRHVNPAGQVTYGNLYSDLLDYVVFAVLLFYVLTIAGVLVLRVKKPDARRPYRTLGYPFLPLLYIAAALGLMAALLLYKTQTAWPGLAILLVGIPVYFLWTHRFTGSRASFEN
jgi:basic amino acid/polyamine antiporter, APA family